MSRSFPHLFDVSSKHVDDILKWCREHNQVLFRDYLVVHLDNSSAFLFKHPDIAMMFKLAYG